MKSKILSAALVTAVLSSFAFGANDKAIELSNKIFAVKKDASAKELIIRDACFKIHNEMLEVTKNMTPDQRDDFNKEFRMQMRKNMATLGKDEYFNPAVCRSVMKKHNRNYGMRNPGMGNPGMGMGGGYNCQSNADCPYNQ
ncbi:hypothetical protein Q4Y15_000380 [Campylobacter fetus]|uniref:DUF1104 domain-containing protein n=5 Tax=Campylobacter fetus TaxID=196 RepID=A0A5L8KY03_CAMFE|nr:hypothetical protein [Campylobacter fetus]OCS23364.1 hypothetical protein CFVI97532_00890 [Campylobacter fetus subsp. venerealis cfvi97/532]OCS26346.1 hypothetical protein CFVB10_04445 [Campylobacter fetus subsp. venerealis cfvB10]OCS30730.1 hypothetical protein CFVCCUG33900_01195 [Campylobacter fetus subsp. venerealis LMG 6570 = CCUG 33900]OCS43008.1 hypothetical protein CFVI02298_01795 [Campylobacter fetus subsp. venerealis cfvi02/298]ABK82434.1 hypothetical protein CFF8240_0839 [Campylob